MSEVPLYAVWETCECFGRCAHQTSTRTLREYNPVCKVNPVILHEVVSLEALFPRGDAVHLQGRGGGGVGVA